MRALRDTVTAAAEPFQRANEYKSTMEMAVSVSVPADVAADLGGVDMGTACCTGPFSLVEGDATVPVAVTRAPGGKCPRCWRVVPGLEGSPGRSCDRCEAA